MPRVEKRWPRRPDDSTLVVLSQVSTKFSILAPSVLNAIYDPFAPAPDVAPVNPKMEEAA